MTILEYILISIIWVGYGIFAGYQDKSFTDDDNEKIAIYIVFILFSPLVFIIKALYGAFKEYNI